MRSRSLLAVVALLIASMVISLGVTPGRISAQDEAALTASVVSGSCDEPGDTAGDLRDLAPAEGGVLTSFTRVDLGIDELTGGDYAVVVSSEGDTIACGDVSGTGNDVYVAVTSRSDAGYGGIAWLHAREDQTQVSLFISQGLGGDAVETPDVPEPPEEDTPTAEAEPTRTPRPSRTPTVEAGEGTTYESPTFGYTVTYDATWTELANETTPTDNGPQDFLKLSNGTSSAYFFTNAAPDSFPCDGVPAVLQSRLEAGTGITDVQIMNDENGDPIQGGNAESTYLAVTFTWTNQDGNVFELYDYFRCYQLTGQPAVLLFLNEGLAVSYDEQGPAREELEASVTIPG